MILTPELAALRQQAREVYPGAVWLPGDEPPLGAIVDSRGERGEVVGPSDIPRMPYRWQVRLIRYDQIELAWPPSLRPVDDR